MTIGEKYHKVLEARGLTINKAEQVLGFGRNTLTNAIKNNRLLTARYQREFIEKFHVKLSWWESGKGEVFDDYTLTPLESTTKVIDFDIKGVDGFDLISYNYKVEYRVTGTATLFDAIVEHSDGESSLWWDEEVPWSIKFKTFDSDFVYLSAQNGNDDSGCLKVEIYWRDKLLKSSQNCGPFEIATVSGGIY